MPRLHVKLFKFLEGLGFHYVIRFRGNIHVSAADGETRLAADWVGQGGRARKLRDAEITAARQKVGAVVCVKAKGMKEAWHLAASDGALSAGEIVALYAKRWTIEPSFRDTKDLRFGMGMSELQIDDSQRRDRLLLLNAFAILLLTLLGAAGESLGMDRQLRTAAKVIESVWVSRIPDFVRERYACGHDRHARDSSPLERRWLEAR